MISHDKRCIPKSRGPGIILAALWLLTATTASADSQQEMLFFTSVDTFETFSESDPAVEDSFVRGTLDLLYSYSTDQRSCRVRAPCSPGGRLPGSLAATATDGMGTNDEIAA